MAPEAIILGSHQVDPRADVYSLGQTVVFITTGKNPHPEHRTPVPLIWESLVKKMTAVAVNDRFQTMEEIVAALPEVRRQLKEQRRAEWSRGHKTAEGLLLQERKVLTWIVQVTNNA